MKRFRILLIIIFLPYSLFSQALKDKEKGLQAIDSASISSTLHFLSSDWMEGREVGRKGAYMAADYIANLFDIYGLKPLSGDSFFQPLQFIEFKGGESQQMEIKAKGKQVVLTHGTDFQLKIPSQIGVSVQSELVFVGYGLTDDKRNDYQGLNTKGKVVVRLSGFPNAKDESSSDYEHYSALGARKLAKLKKKSAISADVAAVLEIDLQKNVAIKWANNVPTHINLPYYEGEEKLSSFYDTKVQNIDSFEDISPVVFNLSERVMKMLIESAILDAYVQGEEGVRKSLNKTLSQSQVKLESTTKSERINCRNVLGKIEGKNPNEVLVIGAHYDHLGMREGYIWNGADDNASGVTAILSIAKAFQAAGKQPEKTIIFAAWTGEEKGLNGSKYFVKHFKQMNQVQLYLNFDMIGRNASWDSEGNKCMMLYTKSFGQLEENDKRNNHGFGLDLDVSYSRVESPDTGSDNASFNAVGVPIYWYHTWGHPDYHQVTDHADKINWTKIQKIIKLSFLNSWDYANGVDFQTQKVIQ